VSGDEQHVELGWIARAQSALTAKYVDDQRLDDVTDWTGSKLPELVTLASERGKYTVGSLFVGSSRLRTEYDS